MTASHTAIRGPVIVTGTDTGVGKTIVTAALAAAAGAAGLSVAVIKPGQTGIPAGSAEERIVTTGQTVGDLIEIITGVKAGDAVATSNVAQLADGVRITETR